MKLSELAACDYARIEAVGGIGGRFDVFVFVIQLVAALAEAVDVAVLEHDALRLAGGSGGIQHDEKVLR